MLHNNAQLICTLYYAGPTSPNVVSVNQTDLVSKQLMFVWSPVAPDCPTVHYNILASNCGSCPTTTNHTTVTCTDVPTDGSTCIFAVQTAVCGNIVGELSDTIQLIPWPLLKEIRGEYKCTGAIISAILFGGTAVCAIIFSATSLVMNIRQKRKSARISTKKDTSDCHYEAVSHDHQHSSPVGESATIDTRENVAYGHTQEL